MCPFGYMGAYMHTTASDVRVFHGLGEALLKEVFGSFGVESVISHCNITNTSERKYK